MCWNQSISWITFIIGTLCNIGGYLWKGNKQNWVLYLFFQLIIMVQLGEALIWRDPNGGVLARIGTIISFLGVWLQPIVAWLILWKYNVRNELLYIMAILVLLYIVTSIPAFIHLQNNTYTPVLCDTDGRYHISFNAWDQPWMGRLYMICNIVSILIVSPQLPYISLYLYFTLFLSYLLYKRLFASLWCWFAVLSPVVFTITESLPSTNITWLYQK